MILTGKWVERTWTFGLPVTMYPVFVDCLRGVPARIEDKIHTWPKEILTKRVGDKWSIKEHIGHLLDLETLGMGRLDDYEAGKEVLRGADMTNQRTSTANHNNTPLDALLATFRAERAKFVARLESYDEAFVQRVALHPRLQQPLRVMDLAYFISEHDDHHLVKMNETKLALSM
jgi:hypothetical protein